MKNILAAFLLMAFCQQTLAQRLSAPQLSPFTKYYLLQQKNGSASEPGFFPYKLGNDGRLYLSCMIKVSDPPQAVSGLEKLGAHVGTKAGDVWTVKVPEERFLAFTQTPGIAYIELDRAAAPLLDKARKATRVDSVQGGYNLPMRYSGKDVVMGVIDFGFDYNHPTFYDTSGHRFRIQKVWELNGSGTPPASYTYGAELTDSNAIRARGTDNAEQFHGTSVAGISAGSGLGSSPAPDRFRGVAYDADLILVGVRRDTIGQQWMQGTFSDFADGVAYIFSNATAQGKPAVVNISWGSATGPHDGTTLFNQACDNLSGPGKVIVMSAGNEGQDMIHLSKTFTATDTALKTFLSFSPDVYKRTWVDAWGEPSKSFCVNVSLYSNGGIISSTGFVCTSDSVQTLNIMGSSGTDTCFVTFLPSAAEFINGKPRITIDVYNKSTDSIALTFSAKSGTINIWDESYFFGYKFKYKSAFTNFGKPGYISGNTISTVSDMGAAQSVILVGAYASKVDFTDINNNAWTYGNYVNVGQIVPFSSRGPMADGRIKPDIAAPGLTIATSMSSYDTAYTPSGSQSDLTIASYIDPISGKTYYYAEFTGTSASAPMASGIVALLLQANPGLTPQDVKNVLFQSAIKDYYTGSLPAAGNTIWGHGKINAYGAIKKVIQQLGVYNFAGEKLDCVLYPNPGKGQFLLDYEAASDGQLSIELYQITGQLVKSEVRSVSRGFNTIPLSYEQLAAGVYSLRVSNSSGVTSIKVVLQ